MLEVAATSLLATKLHIPRPRRALVARPRLLKQLDSSAGYALTLVSAPAGFGKTTLLAEWAAQSSYPVGWLSLDAGDNDPVRFWTYLIAALETVQPGISGGAASFLDAPSAPAIETVVTALINALAASPADCGLIVDDYDAIEKTAIHSEITFLLDHAPANLHLILATRSDPLLPLARLRARDAVLEVRAAELRFNVDETGEFLQEAMHLALTVDQVAALEARTEGWIAGLQLAALALGAQDAGHVADFVAASVGSNRYVIDYLVEEVLAGQEPAVQDFLRQTAILDRLAPALCDAVTGRNDSAEMLAYLEKMNLFVSRLDQSEQWYRYHNLFADVLRKLLGQRDPGLVQELHRRAAAWYAQQRMQRNAIVHALAIPDYGQVAGLIEEAGMPVLSRGTALVTLEWLRALPPELLRSRPQLCLYRAAAGIAAGEGEDVEAWLRAAEQGIAQEPPGALAGAVMSGHLAALRAMLAARAGEHTRVIELSEHALACLPASQVVLRGIAAWIRGQAYEHTGETTSANEALAETISASQAAVDCLHSATSLYTLGFLEFCHGRLAQAHEYYFRALQVIDEHEVASRPLMALICLGVGELLYEQDDLAAAQEYIDRSLRLYSTWDNPDASVHGQIARARLCQARGDIPAALAVLDAALPAAIGRAAAGTLEVVQAQRAQLWILQGNLPAAGQWAHERRLRFWQESRDLAHHFPRYHELVVWARLLLAQNQPAEALAVLDVLAPVATSNGWTSCAIRVLALCGLAHEMQGDHTEALAFVTQALIVAARQGHVRVFADEGGPLTALLAAGKRAGVWQDPLLAAHVDRVLAATTAASRYRVGDRGRLFTDAALSPLHATTGHEAAAIGSSRLVEPLSQRELEVLRLVADGLGNRAIADRLIVSVGTVKSHMHSIYGKLGAQDRGQAVVQAHELDLL